MTRDQLIAKLVNKEKKNIIYNSGQIISKFATMSPEEKQALADAINTSDKSIIGAVIDTFFDAQKNIDATAAVNAKIVNDKIDIDDVAAVINGATI